MIQTNEDKINNKQIFNNYSLNPVWQTAIHRETTNKTTLYQLQWQAKEES
jgi:hypothetical protein